MVYNICGLCKLLNFRWYKFKEVTAFDGLKKASKRQK